MKSAYLVASMMAVGMGSLSPATASAAIFKEYTDGAATVGSELGTSFLINAASTGGSDTDSTGTPRSMTLDRTFAALNVGAGGSQISITGLAFALNAAVSTTVGNTNGNVITATVTYLGANGVGGGGDDVLLGSQKATLQFTTGAGVYAWDFDTDLVGVIDGANSKFRVLLESLSADNGGSTFNMRFKSTATNDFTTVKTTVAGTSVAVLPEPGSVALLGMLGLIARRRPRA